MRLIHHTLRFGDHLDLVQQPHDGLHLLHGSGRGVQADVPAGWTSIWWPLRGRISLATPGSDWQLGSRDLQVWREGPLRCRSLGPQGWLGLAGPAQAWPQYAAAHAAELFPWQGRVWRDTAGLLMRLARYAPLSITPQAGDQEAWVTALSASLLEQQQSLHALLSRCNGRTLARRQQTLMRLLRVRHQIHCHPDVRLDLECLAKTANYSPCHLIRVYRAVFGETPSEYAARRREEQAWRMVSDTALPICEITGMVGFESQSAFCRAFKNTFGITASEARRQLAERALAA
jgi:AraC-like DNA-binding protein